MVLKNLYAYKYGYDVGNGLQTSVSTDGTGLKIMRSTNDGKTYKQLGQTLKFGSIPTPVPNPSTTLNREKIAVINSCTVLSDAQIKQMTIDFQTALDRDFTPIWGAAAELVFVRKGSTPPAGAWWLTFLDDADIQDALGYHDITNEGLPIGKAFVKTDIDNGYLPSVTATHELWEMLVDPWISLCAQIQMANGNLRDYAFETGDPVEADQFGYKVGSTLISDFVYPAWFEPFRKSGPFDFQKKVTKPFQLLKGGYLQYIDFNSSAGWQQQFAQDVTQQAGAHKNTFSYKQLGHKGSRRERRIRGKFSWLKSSVQFSKVKRILAK